MKNTLAAAGLVALLTTTAFSAEAAERWPRWYIGLTGGFTVMSDQDISGSTGASQISLDSGYGLGASIGYLPSSSAPILNSLRLEAEITHHKTDIDSVTINGAGVAGNGELYSTAYMANLFYDFPTNSAWSPYIGGGIGFAQIHLDNAAGNTDETAVEFAYQALAGFGYSPASLPNTQWSIGYRYLATTDADFGNMDMEYSTHSVEAGAKFRF